MQHNVDTNLPSALCANVVVEGYTWGTAMTKLQSLVPEGKYDVIILSDLVFNHSQHHALLRTCSALLRPKTGCVYVFYTHHRPLLADRDLDFFTIAQRPVMANADRDDRDSLGYGFKVHEFVEQKDEMSCLKKTLAIRKFAPQSMVGGCGSHKGRPVRLVAATSPPFSLFLICLLHSA